MSRVKSRSSATGRSRFGRKETRSETIVKEDLEMICSTAKMIDSTARDSGTKTTALFAYAAGVTGILANVLLVAFFVLRAAEDLPIGSNGEMQGA